MSLDADSPDDESENGRDLFVYCAHKRSIVMKMNIIDADGKYIMKSGLKDDRLIMFEEKKHELLEHFNKQPEDTLACLGRIKRGSLHEVDCSASPGKKKMNFPAQG